MIETHYLTVGMFRENCHFLRNPETGDIVVVDPGDEPEAIFEMLGRLGGRVVAIWNTHGHVDHVGANAAVKARTGAPISIHRADEPLLGRVGRFFAMRLGVQLAESEADVLWDGGESIEALGRTWTVHHLPGHCAGHCAIACAEEKLIVGGDLIIQGAIGRTDLPGGDETVMMESLRRFFAIAGDDWRILPGHGEPSLAGQERRRNPFVQMALKGATRVGI